MGVIQKKKEDTSNKKDKIYENHILGEVGKTGDYQLKTTSYKEVTEIKGVGREYKTDNKYVVVDIEIAANDIALQLGYSPMDFILVDEERKTFNTSDATNDINVLNSSDNDSYVGIYDSINPGVFKKTQLVFEVPKDTVPKLIANKNQGSTDYVEFMIK